MGFSDDDRILIENLYIFKGNGTKKLIKELPDKGWGLRELNKLLRKLRDIGTTARRSGSGRPRTARIDDNIDAVNDLVLSQEDAPKTHRSKRQIARETGIHHSSVYRIVPKDLRLRCLQKRRVQELTAANHDARLTRAKKLLRLYLQSAVDFTVASPVNLQNDRVYVPQSSKKRDVAADRLLRTRPTFSKSLMVSVAVSKLGCTELIFVQPGAKVNGAYYRDELLAKHTLPAI